MNHSENKGIDSKRGLFKVDLTKLTVVVLLNTRPTNNNREMKFEEILKQVPNGWVQVGPSNPKRGKHQVGQNHFEPFNGLIN